ncbi:hypothetical protein B0H14DRAFT_316253 [Mycena olivaceomarginata]|nr:hypothetical protein B0H14DRAFT_316253 [Mycena olivaceomarginata]
MNYRHSPAESRMGDWEDFERYISTRRSGRTWTGCSTDKTCTKTLLSRPLLRPPTEGKPGTPCRVFIDHMYVHTISQSWWKMADISPSCDTVDAEAATVRFQDGATVTADLIIGADGIHISPRRFSF